MSKVEITYEAYVDSSKLESDLADAQKVVEKAAKKTIDNLGKFTKELADKNKAAKKDVSDYNDEQNKRQEKSDDESGKKRAETAKKHGASIQDVFGKAAKAVGKGMLSAGTEIVGLGTMAVKSAVSMDQAMNSFIASTGKGTKEIDVYQGALENIYKNNFGEDFQDIADAMVQVTKNMGEMDAATLQEMTESAFALQDTFKYDLSESTQAAKEMMDQFGITGNKAMNLIVAGAQNNLAYSNELLDSVSAYSAEFAKVGLDADDMFKIFQKGSELGVGSLEQIGNAVREMAIRVVDGSDSTTEGFSAIGLNADEMAAKFASGGDSAKEAFQQTLDAIASVEDPLAQSTAGAALFGSTWKELGPGVITQLANIEDGAYGTGEELNKLKDINCKDLGSMFEELKRAAELLLLPIGEQLIPVLSELVEAILPIVEEVLPPFIEVVGVLVKELMPLIEDILPILRDLFEQLIPPITDIIQAIFPVLIELVDALLPILQVLIDLLMPIVDLFIELLTPILSLISQALTPLIEALTPIVEVISSLLIPILQVLMSVFSEVFSGIVQVVSDYIGRIVKHINLIVDFIKNIFKGNWKDAWQNIIDIFKNIIGGIGDFFKAPINYLIDQINGFIKGINKIKVPDWFPVIGGMSFNLPTIPRLRIGMDYVPSDDFPALLHKGEAVLTAQENALYRSNGGIEGVLQVFSERGYKDANNDATKTIVIHNHMEVDGREIARSTAEYVSEQLPWEEL